MFLTRLDAETIFVRGLLAERERELEALRERAADDAETAAQNLLAARREIAALRRALDEAREAARAEPLAVPAAVVADARAEIPNMPERPPVQAPPEAPVQAPMQASLGACEHEHRHRPLRRTMALPIWLLVRPFARPLVWRARTFLMAETTREITAVRAAQDAIHGATRSAIEDAARRIVEEALDRVAPPPPAPPPAPPRTVDHGPSYGIGLGDTAAERWLLTAALETSAQRSG